MGERVVSAGQRAYEADLIRIPRYPNGQQRATWAELPEYARRSWERHAQPSDLTWTA